MIETLDGMDDYDEHCYCEKDEKGWYCCMCGDYES
jgi:hypothetical protein